VAFTPGFYLGVDGGASKTSAVLTDKNGEEISEGFSEGSNFESSGFNKSLVNLKEAVQEATKDSDLAKIKSCFALAGVNIEANKKDWEKLIQKDPFLSQLAKPKIVNDTKAALRSATEDKNAIVVICGTGSNCWGHNREGKEASSGGLGHILSDEGSGYSIGLAALHAITKALDGRGGKTVMTSLLFDKYGLKSKDDLVSLVYGKNNWTKKEVAQVVETVKSAAEKGDRTAGEILEDSAGELALMVKTVSQKLEIRDKKYLLAMSGSVFKIKKLFADKFARKVRQFSPLAEFENPKMSTAEAAAILAREEF